MLRKINNQCNADNMVNKKMSPDATVKLRLFYFVFIHQSTEKSYEDEPTFLNYVIISGSCGQEFKKLP